MQICLLGQGAVIGDMALRGSEVQKNWRATTVMALTEVQSCSISLREFRRRVPPSVVDALMAVADAKVVMTRDHMAHERGRVRHMSSHVTPYECARVSVCVQL